MVFNTVYNHLKITPAAFKKQTLKELFLPLLPVSTKSNKLSTAGIETYLCFFVEHTILYEGLGLGKC